MMVGSLFILVAVCGGAFLLALVVAAVYFIMQERKGGEG